LHSSVSSPSPPLLFFLFTLPPPPSSTLFPYPTLFRSVGQVLPGSSDARDLRLPAEFAFGADFACDARDFRGKAVELVHHRIDSRSEEHTSELQSLTNLVCRLLLEKKQTHILHAPKPTI